MELARHLVVASLIAACAGAAPPPKPRQLPIEPTASSTAREAAPRAPGCADSSFQWNDVEPGLQTLDESFDLDGDQRPDQLIGSASWGSGAESRTVSVELTRDGSTIEVSTNSSFDTMVSREAVPARLVGMPTVRRAIELALFDRVCDAPDPSLALVLRGTPAWSPGPPALVPSYTVLVGNEWISYAALNHKRTATLDLTGGFKEVARLGSLVLMTTAHGAVIVDERAGRHSWVLVIESAKRKLRFPSVTRGELRGDRALVTVDGTVTRVKLPAP